MKLSKIDRFTILTAVMGLIVDLSAVQGWIGDIISSPSGSSEMPGLMWAIISFYSLTSVSFYVRRLLYKDKVRKNISRRQTGGAVLIRDSTVERKSPRVAVSEPPRMDRTISCSITDEQKRSVDNAEFCVTGLSSVAILAPMVLSVDWDRLSFNIGYYTFVLQDPSHVVLVSFSCASLMFMASLVASHLHKSIIESD